MRNIAALLLRNPLYALLAVLICTFLPDLWAMGIVATGTNATHISGFLAVVVMILMAALRVIAGAPIALVTLRNGARPGFLLLALCTAATLLWSQVATQSLDTGLMSIGLCFVPAFICAWILRQSVSLAFTLQLMTLIVALLLIFAGFMGWLPDPALVKQVIMSAAPANAPNASAEMTPEQMALLGEMFISFLAYTIPAGLLTSQLMTLCLARWWQAMLFNPGGFQQEFHHLRLPKTVAVSAFLVVCLGLLPIPVAVTMPFVFQGIVGLLLTLLVIPATGFVHWWFAHKQVGTAWFVFFYVLLAIFGLWLIPLLAVLSVMDSVSDLRARTMRSKSK
jgi:hypothetical protein